MAHYEVHWLNSEGRVIALHGADCQNDAEARELVRQLVQYSNTKRCLLFRGSQPVPLTVAPPEVQATASI